MTSFTQTHAISTRTFFYDFVAYLKLFILCQYPILITGDFNIHVDDSLNTDALRLYDILESFKLDQHVNDPTHTHGHALNFAITRAGDHILKKPPKVDFRISDDVSIICCPSVLKPPLLKKSVQHRKLKNINIFALKRDLLSSSLFSQSHPNLKEFSERFNTTQSSLLDVHAPLSKKNVTIRPRVPWFSDAIKMVKRRRRKAKKL